MSERLTDKEIDRLKYMGQNNYSVPGGHLVNAVNEINALRAERDRYKAALEEILGLGRTSLKPDVYPDDDSWLFHKVNEMTRDARSALSEKQEE